MIDSVSNTTQQTSTTPATAANSAQGSTTYHTPFGDVLVNEAMTTDIYSLFNGSQSAGSSGSKSPATAAAVATPAAAAAVATPAAQPTVPQSAPDPTPTVQSVFGPNAWEQSPGGTGPNGMAWQFNPTYFATPETAAKVASMVGGTVVESSAILGPGPLVQNQPNEMVQLADGKLINPGLVATFFSHGYPQSYVDRLLQNEVQGA